MLDNELDMLAEIPATNETSATIAATPITTLKIVNPVLSLRCDMPFSASQIVSLVFI